jgi:hypothetical protein
LYTNTPLEIKSLGFGIDCLEKYKDFEVGVNYNYAEFNFDQSQDPSLKLDSIRLNTECFGNENYLRTLVSMLVEDITHLIYGIVMVDGMIDAATVIDAQINYGIPS